MTIQTRMVPDPSMSDAQYLYEKRQEAERAERSGRPIRLDVGKVAVAENPITRIGALVYIRRRTQMHERAAEKFKSHYEALYGSGMPAVDAGRIQVDGGRMTHDARMVADLDRHGQLYDAMAALGKPASDRVVAVVVLGMPPRQIIDGESKRQVRHEVDALLASLDEIAAMWGLRTGT